MDKSLSIWLPRSISIEAWLYFQRRRKQLGVGGARSRWPIRLRRCAENHELRTVVLIRTCTYTLAPARAIDGHAEIRPSLAPHLARMLEQESVSATLGSQPTLP